MKTCTRCARALPLNDFYFSRVKGSHRSRCKSCFKELERGKGWARISVAVHRRNDRLSGLYIAEKHITEQFLAGQYAAQEGRCIYPDCRQVLCTKTPRYQPDSLTVDRLSNYAGHSCDNCVLACRGCQTRNKKCIRKVSNLDKLAGLTYPFIKSATSFKKIRRDFARRGAFA